MDTSNLSVAERLGECCELAISIGWGVADILKNARNHDFEVGGAQDSPVTSADLAANDYILSRLHTQLGTTDFGYLSEETFKTQNPIDRLSQDWVWIIDPLDGTKDYIQNTGEYATHIALAYRGQPMVAVVGCPGKDRLYWAIRGQGSWVNTAPNSSCGGTSRNSETSLGVVPTRNHISPKNTVSEMTIVTSRNHLGKKLEDLIKHLGISSHKGMGSVGCKVSTLVDQGADLYVSIAGKTAPKDWDFAAPELILTEAGGRFTYFNGGSISYNCEDINQWHPILASNSTQHDFICATAQAFLNQYD